MIERFPIYKADYIFNEFYGKISNNKSLQYKEISISYPIRLDAMAINPSAVCYNDSMIFTPGEVVVSANKFIKVYIKVTNKNDSVEISDSTRRKVLVKHAYYLMKKVINFTNGLYIDVDDKDIPKHCGFGSSSSTISAVAAAINEMFSHPISNEDLIKYLASNHGEEIDDNNENDLKMVQCIGGGATGGLTEAGIIIIAGKSTTIAKMKYNAKILIALPKDFKEQNADVLMKKEEENLWKFKETGEKYSKDIAYHLLHKSLPGMVNGEIKDLSDIVFKYRFDMGSIENCSFVYEKMVDLANKLRVLYEEKRCDFLTLSSVGPAFFAITTNDKDFHYCKEYNIEFINASFDNLPLKNESFDLILSIGVLHNATTLNEIEKAFSEMNRILRKNGMIILSIFTNDVITDDLIHNSGYLYNIKNRPPMVLLSKKKIIEYVEHNNFKIIKKIDEHITDVGNGGKRNVYSLLLQKES